MAWEHVPHTSCTKPLFGAVFMPSGSIWKCDHPGCGKRYKLTRVQGDQGPQIRWVPL